MIRSLVTSMVVVGAIVGCAASADAQSNAFTYDSTAEVAISGTVTAVIPIPDAEGTVGVHLTVKTETGLISIHLGPAMFIGMNNFYFRFGDQVEVLGTRLSGEEPAVIARSIKKADRTLTLRDKTGAPAWTPNVEGTDGCGVAHTVGNAGSDE